MALKRTIEESYDYVRVRGELGKVSYHGNGHVYFDLKDDRACIAGVIWRSAAQRIKLKLEAGLEVVVTGRITTYPSRSQYQIVVETLEPAGLGALMALVEERKKRLAAEGLFDPARKHLLPFLPDVIGVITSPTGAVIRDILHRLADRFPRHVLVWPVRVQGEGSAEEVAAAIRGFNALPQALAMPRPDLLIVARGGGSLEDLWSFNDETVVRAAAASMIPLISAVGHETDVTLIDFAADRRAPTPTAAAEMAVPVRAELLVQRRRPCAPQSRLLAARPGRAADRTARRRARAAERRCAARAAAPAARRRGRTAAAGAARQRAASSHAVLAHRRAAEPAAPGQRGSRAAAELTAALGARAARAGANLQQRRRDRLAAASERLSAGVRANVEAHRARTARERERVLALSARGHRASLTLIRQRAAMVERAGQLLVALSYRRVLARGFALVRDADGLTLRAQPQRSSPACGSTSSLPMAASARLPRAKARQPRCPVPRSRGGRGDSGQGNLFGT